MAAMWWAWESESEGNRLTFRELDLDFTIHKDIGNFSDLHGIYFMLCFSHISDVKFYFGLQTDAWLGKRAIFSRWGTLDLTNTRVAPGGWTQSSSNEGEFVGVRLGYNWGVGSYQARLASDGVESDGEWFGLWITDMSSGTETWIGSLKFPLLNDTARIKASMYTTIEVYGSTPIPLNQIPESHISMKRPSGDDVVASSGEISYSGYHNLSLLMDNANVRYDEQDDRVHFQAGGDTENTTPAGKLTFK